MTTREMTVQEHARQAREFLFLAASDREFASGDHLQAAGKLYGAASHAVIAAAKQRGWGHRTHRETKNVTVRLAAGYGDSHLQSGFVAAEKFHKHFFHNEMEDYEREADCPLVHEFVELIWELSTNDGIGPATVGKTSHPNQRHHLMVCIAGLKLGNYVLAHDLYLPHQLLVFHTRPLHPEDKLVDP